jgi:uncharacterized SAM-binding protein YcdF (DUF218 family)
VKELKGIQFEPDVFVILGASLSDAVTLSPQSYENLKKLQEEKKRWKMKKSLILSGGFSINGIESEASLLENILSYFKEEFSLICEDKSKNSAQNIEFSLKIIQEHTWRNVAVIDQPLHLFQLKLLFKHFIRVKHLNIHLEFIPAEAVYGNNVKWWQYSHPIVYFTYLALCNCYYLLRRKITITDIFQVLWEG